MGAPLPDRPVRVPQQRETGLPYRHAEDFPLTPGDRPCRCGCPHSMHQHYRAAEDCGRCGRAVCRRYRRPSLLTRLVNR